MWTPDGEVELAHWTVGTNVCMWTENPSFKGEVEVGGVYAIEPFNTTGSSGMIENVPPA